LVVIAILGYLSAMIGHTEEYSLRPADAPGIFSLSLEKDLAPAAERMPRGRSSPRSPGAQGTERCVSEPLGSHKCPGRPGRWGERPATVSRVTNPAAIARRLVRTLLLACTVFGLAALHTIGHAAVPHSGDQLRVATWAAVVTVADPSDDGDGCGNDGCSHSALTIMDTDDAFHWIDVCVAVFSVLVIGALLAGRLLPTSHGAAGPGNARRRRRSSSASHQLAGLTVTALAVIRT
jgi:hypothetical protein